MKSRSSKLIAVAIVVAAIIGMAGLYHINGDSFDLNGRQAVLVTTDSMDGDVHEYKIDSFPANTLVMIKHIPDSQKRFLRAGDVISYYNANDVLVHHRIVQADNGFVYVHGDNNTATEKVAFDDINGKVVGTNWIAGHAIAFISDNLPMILAGAFVLSSILAVHAVYRREKDGKGNAKKLVTSIAVVMILAVSFTGIGYAAGYHGWTTNDNNVVNSEYVVLTQTNYTLTNEDLRFDVIETDAGKVYRLLGNCENLVNIYGRNYYGVQIGSDSRFTATKIGGTGDTVDIVMENLTLEGEWYTDFSANLQDWLYILRIVNDNDDAVIGYAYYDGAEGGTWKYLDSTGHSITGFTLTKDVHYITSLFFAGIGEYSSASFRAAGATLKLSSSVTVCPVWKPSSESDDTFKCTFKSGGSEPDRVMYMTKGSDLTLPDNLFTAPSGKEFVGWDEEDGKTWMPWHTFKSNSKSRTFTALWENDSSKYKTITFAGGEGSSGTMAAQYVLNGNTYTLPMCTYTKSGYTFDHWTVTSAGSRDYSKYIAPFTDISELDENITVTAVWKAVSNKDFEVSIQETPMPSAKKYIAYSDDMFTLTDCIFGPPANLDDPAFEGWEFMGWTVFKTKINTVPQSYTMPDGSDGYIIKNATIKFVYSNDSSN